MDLETLRMVAGGATILAGGLGVSLSTAVIGAMVEAVSPGMPSRVWAGTISGLSVAVKALCLVAVAGVALVLAALVGLVAVFRWPVEWIKGTGLAVTFLHTHPADGRHEWRANRRGNLLQGAGRHRLA